MTKHAYPLGSTRTTMTAHHPYVPTDLHLPGFVPNVLPYETILTVFFGCSALVVLFMFVLTGTNK